MCRPCGTSYAEMCPLRELASRGCCVVSPLLLSIFDMLMRDVGCLQMSSLRAGRFSANDADGPGALFNTPCPVLSSFCLGAPSASQGCYYIASVCRPDTRYRQGKATTKRRRCQFVSCARTGILCSTPAGDSNCSIAAHEATCAATPPRDGSSGCAPDAHERPNVVRFILPANLELDNSKAPRGYDIAHGVDALRVDRGNRTARSSTIRASRVGDPPFPAGCVLGT